MMRAPDVKTKTTDAGCCRGCGVAIEQAGLGRPRAFCLDCRPRVAVPAVYVPRPKIVISCAHCGDPFTGTAGKVFCSARCQDHARPRQACWACGGPSGYRVGNRVQSASGAIICRPCRTVLAKPRPIQGPFEWACLRCGKVCSKLSAKGQRPKYCSKTCQASAAWHRRRAREVEAFVEEVSPADVFYADGFRCYLCNAMTDPTKRVPHPLAPTVDHVVPLNAGGLHERGNCRTACFRCNCSKQDRGGGEQFALVLDLERPAS